MGAAWLLATGLAFQLGAPLVGYLLGGMLTLVGALVSTVDICIPSMIYRAMFGYRGGRPSSTASPPRVDAAARRQRRAVRLT